MSKHIFAAASTALVLCFDVSGMSADAQVAGGVCNGCVVNAPAATLPNGRLITPAGGWIPLAPFPFGMALRPDGEQIVAPSVGWPFSLNFIEHPESIEHLESADEAGSQPSTTRLPPGRNNDPAIQVLTGVAYSLDGKTLYVATGDSGAIHVMTAESGSWQKTAEIPLDGSVQEDSKKKTYSGSFAGTIALSPDGRFLYVVDQGNWRIVVINTANCTRVASIATGSNPFGITLAPDGKRLYVTNSGLFEYRPIEGKLSGNSITRGLSFPPTGYPSQQARNGIIVEGRRVPGLGDENSVRGSSVWTYDVASPPFPKRIAQLRLGAPIAARSGGVLGGASPSGIAADEDHIYVALAHQDAIAVVTADGRKLETSIGLTPFQTREFRDNHGRPLRGLEPAGLALRGSRLYVTEAGINAVAVIDTASARVLGHIPVGWSPSSVALSPDGHTLYVTNTKGKGAGPNGGTRVSAGAPTYIGDLEAGSLSVIPLTPQLDWDRLTQTVVQDNRAAAPAGAPSLPRAKHVFLIIRENRTFDEILGDLPGANGDPKLARWGMQGWVENSELAGLHVTPNAHALAQQFATSDNFYVDSDVSADGHRWAVGIAPTPWFNIAWTSDYGGRRHEDPLSKAPGRRALAGGSDGPMPEDEPEFGSLWEHVASNGLKLYNYGEGLEIEGGDEIFGLAPTGQRVLLNSPIPQPVFEATDRIFPTFNLGIPDQVRFREFSRNFGRKIKAGTVPSLIVIRLPGDHTASPRPADGYPYKASYVADNDLALGKIVDFLSHSSIWKDSAVFVIEDDAQSGVDHVDAHRSVVLVMGPNVRPGYISHKHTSTVSVQKTIYELLGLGPLNLEDALAGDMGDLFTSSIHPSPFTALPSDPRLFQPEKARVAHPRTAAQAAELLDCDDPREIAEEFHKRAAAASKSATGAP